MRSFGAAVSIILALVLTAVAVPSIWLDQHVVQEDGFVALAGPLGSDPGFQKSLAGAVATTASAQLDLPAGLNDLAAGLIRKAADAVSSDPGYPAAWSQTLRRSHAQTFSDTGSGQDGLMLDVAPLVGLVAARVGSETGVTVEAPKQMLIQVGKPVQRQMVDTVRNVGQAGYWLAAGAVVFLILGLVLARRRSTTILLAGLGLALVAGAWKLAEVAAVSFVRGNDTGNAVADLFADRLTALSEHSVDRWILVTLLVAGVMLLGGVLGRSFARTPPRRI